MCVHVIVFMCNCVCTCTCISYYRIIRVSSVKKATWSNDEEMEGPSKKTSDNRFEYLSFSFFKGELFKQDARIKASRCSINKKSKHNT